MSDTDKIYVDPTPPATLYHAAGPMLCYTLQEAVMAWHRLPDQQRKAATIRVAGGPLYSAPEIERLHYGPKPDHKS